jgi:RimJ/RimL family protein N-acetyltransferase
MARIEPRRATVRGGEVLIRSLEEGDAPEALRATREMFSTADYTLTTLAEFTLTEDAERAYIRGVLEASHSVFFSAFDGGRIVGSLGVMGGAKRKVAHQGVVGMGLVEPWRNRGLGRVMLQAAIDWARAHQTLQILTLGVYEVNAPAVHLYTSMGFVEYGRLPRALRHADGSEHINLDMFLRVKP